MKFKGYRRADGSIGIRNHILIIPTVSCVNRVAMEICARTRAVTFTHPYGCTFDAEENNTTEHAYIGYGRHPNVGAVLVLSLGCEPASAVKVADAIRETGKPVEMQTVKLVGGARAPGRPGTYNVHRLLEVPDN